VIVLVSTAGGNFAIDLEAGELEPAEAFTPPTPPKVNLPRVVAAAKTGATILVAVDARPPLLVSHDAGSTWRESGRGLPPGRAVAVSDASPDSMVFAARNRLYLSRDGGVFWEAIPVELPEIEALALTT